MTTLESEILRLQSQPPIEGMSYHFLTFLGTEDGRVYRSVSSTWVGYTKTRPRREIRGPVLAEPNKLRVLLESVGTPGLLVNDSKDLLVFVLVGGHGIVKHNLANAHFPELMQPREVMQSWAQGWISVADAAPAVVQRAPSRRARMQIIKRDSMRCRICGRSPSDNVDIQLDVHHIIPWGQGGATEDTNLITLCDTCHGGLDPHADYTLFDLIGVGMLQDIPRDRHEYLAGRRRYLEITRKLLRERDRTSGAS